MNGTGFPLTALLHGKAPFKKKKKKEKTANASTPSQVLNQLCRKAAAWIANQNPYTRPPSPLSAQDTVRPTTTNTQNSC